MEKETAVTSLNRTMVSNMSLLQIITVTKTMVQGGNFNSLYKLHGRNLCYKGQVHKLYF